MKKRLYDDEIRLECYCGEADHFINFGYSHEEKSEKDDLIFGGYSFGPTLDIEFRVWNGSLKNRLREAWRLIWSGWKNGYADVETVGVDELVKLRDFLDRCIEKECAAKVRP